MDPERVFAEYPGRGDTALPVLVARLLDAQTGAWPDLARGMQALSSAQVRTIVAEHYSALVQFNPIRITSTGAKVDPHSIARRRCFLCLENLPEPQQGVLYHNDYLVLCNPAPIFRGHFTISHVDHQPQAIGGAITALLGLARDLSPSYQVFYNGPRCGASAPDHMHFQACPTGSIPLADRGFLANHANGSVRVNDTLVTLLRDTDRSVLAYSAPSRPEAALVLERIIRSAGGVLGSSDEPLLNILAWWSESMWEIVVILRSKHRPEDYFREDEGRLMISPAAVDMGGFVITPRQEDFARLNAATVQRIFREVSLDGPTAVSILEGIR